MHFLNLLLRLLFSHYLRIIFLLMGLGVYTCFLRNQASILRAWIMCSLPLIAELTHRTDNPSQFARYRSLNGFGISTSLLSKYRVSAQLRRYGSHSPFLFSFASCLKHLISHKTTEGSHLDEQLESTWVLPAHFFETRMCAIPCRQCVCFSSNSLLFPSILLDQFVI